MDEYDATPAQAVGWECPGPASGNLPHTVVNQEMKQSTALPKAALRLPLPNADGTRWTSQERGNHEQGGRNHNDRGIVQFTGPG